MSDVFVSSSWRLTINQSSDLDSRESHLFFPANKNARWDDVG